MSNSVAVVVLDSVRKGYFDEHLDWLDGVWFDNAWSTGNYSIPAHGSLFGGAYPSELGVHAKSQALDCPDPVLAEKLQSAGYRTRAYSANALVAPEFGFDRGFEEYNVRWDLSGTFPELFSWREELLAGPDGVVNYPRALVKCLLDPNSKTLASIRRALQVYGYDDEGVREALQFVKDVDFGDREFLFLNLMEAHWPYWGSGDYLTYDENPVEVNGETIPGGDIDLSAHEHGYEEWVAYLSEQYERLHEELLASFDYVVTLSDHGDLFGEHGAKAHYYGLFEELTRVPLVIADGSGVTEHRDDVASLIDVHATVCALSGVDTGRRGANLLEGTQDEHRLVEFHGFRQDRLDSLEDSGFDRAEIDRYDVYLAGLAMREDYYGYETLDGFEERGTPVDDPRDALDDLLDNLDVRDIDDETDETVSEETQERLRELGYM